MYTRLHVKCPFLLSDLTKLGFSPQIFEKKKVQKSNFMRIRPVGAEFFHADG